MRTPIRSLPHLVWRPALASAAWALSFTGGLLVRRISRNGRRQPFRHRRWPSAHSGELSFSTLLERRPIRGGSRRNTGIAIRTKTRMTACTPSRSGTGGDGGRWSCRTANGAALNMPLNRSWFSRLVDPVAPLVVGRMLMATPSHADGMCPCEQYTSYEGWRWWRPSGCRCRPWRPPDLAEDVRRRGATGDDTLAFIRRT